jgi:hypothetical protein
VAGWPRARDRHSPPRPEPAALLGLLGRASFQDRLAAILKQKFTFMEVKMRTKIMLASALVLAVALVGTARPVAGSASGGTVTVLAEAPRLGPLKKAMAARIAELLGEPVGGRAGFRVRSAVRVSRSTRIEVVTEALLTRAIQADPLLEGVGLLAELLKQAPGVKLLVTSRERLNMQGEWLFDLQGLPVPPLDQVDRAGEYSAVALFVQSAQRAQVGFELRAEERPWAARICQLVEGMPLALELAAAWAEGAAMPLARVEKIEQRLRQDQPCQHQ